MLQIPSINELTAHPQTLKLREHYLSNGTFSVLVYLLFSTPLFPTKINKTIFYTIVWFLHPILSLLTSLFLFVYFNYVQLLWLSRLTQALESAGARS